MYNKEESELNYRYKVKLSQEEKMNEGRFCFNKEGVNDIDKMKLIGKIGSEATFLDPNSASGDFHFSFSIII